MCPFSPEETSRYQDFNETMSFYQNHNVSIKFGSDSEDKNPPQHISSLFTKTLQFRRLTLNPIRIGGPAELELLLGILSSSRDLLEELSLGLGTFAVSREESSQLLRDYWTHKFPKMTRLSLSSQNQDQDGTDTFFTGILPVFPALQNLTVSGNLLPLLFSNKDSAKTMSSITKLTLASSPIPLKPDELHPLLLLPTGQLSKLTLNSIQSPDGAMSDLYFLLSRQSATLTELTLQIHHHFSGFLLFPSFPALKKFSFSMQHGDVEIYFIKPGFSTATPGQQVGLILAKNYYGGIDYGYHFPKLESFRCDALGGTWSATCFKAWFPYDFRNPAYVCKTVKYFEFMEHDTKERLREGKIADKYTRLPRLFPNASNEYVQLIKKCSP
ncbi:uncharacterized protein LOC118438604 [Folsomia candida]|uniref:uncharacterized protein LOC118438604 n=1 Tax=Folsomia candida TaxID=158441 RepID=UPI001604DEFB|nr:uncharacterized protein LOC118438604 [Folsomia candida]